jgi:hypothetical protein
MAKKTTHKVKVTGNIKRVKPEDDGKFTFVLEGCTVDALCVQNGGNIARRTTYMFTTSAEKALVVANGDREFPHGIPLTVEGQQSGNSAVITLTYAKIIAVDGVDPRAWAERHGSTTVAPEVAESAQERVKAQEKAEEALMREKAPPEPTPHFKTPREAFDRAMYLVRRQAKLKEPRLSRDDIFQMRDALNTLKEAAGL